MTVIIKYQAQSKKRNEEFFKRKDQELTNLDWAKWAGWFDTDGCFTTHYNKANKRIQKFADLRLTDRQPVELFSEIFETSLRYSEGKTTTPDGKHYIAKVYRAALSGPKAEWFTENVSPYLIKESKREYASTLLDSTVRSKDFKIWTPNELTHYLATVIEGDGGVQVKTVGNSTSVKVAITSNDPQYFANIVSISANKLGIISRFTKVGTYKTKRGMVDLYRLYILCSKSNHENLNFLKSLLQYNVMTLDRKKERVQDFVNYMDLKELKSPASENRI